MARILFPALSLFVLLLVPAAAPAEGPYTQQQNVVYGEVDGIGLVMDIFTPTGNKNGLGIVDIASGAFHSDRSKIRDHEMAQVYNIFCKKGYVVFAVRPGSITKFGVPEMLGNIRTGIRWVKAHSKEHGIDPERLGLTGASAGGHLACLTAVSAEGGAGDGSGTAVKAAGVFFPLTDLLNYNGQAADPRSEGRLGVLARQLAFPKGIAGLSDEDVQKGITQICPARLVTKNAPPFLIIHGDADPVVPLQQSQLMVDTLKKAGVSAELIIKAGGGHPWLTIPEEVQKMADWFDKQLTTK